MQIATDRPQAPTAIRTDLGAIFVSLKLSRSTWLITSLSPGGGEKMSKHTVRSGDIAGLRTRFSQLKDKVQVRMGQIVPIIVIQEAGLDGFWIHRLLQDEGVESHVVDPAPPVAARSLFRSDIPWAGDRNWEVCGELSGLRWLRGSACGPILPWESTSVWFKLSVKWVKYRQLSCRTFPLGDVPPLAIVHNAS